MHKVPNIIISCHYLHVSGFRGIAAAPLSAAAKLLATETHQCEISVKSVCGALHHVYGAWQDVR
jgi:hypothetical protein